MFCLLTGTPSSSPSMMTLLSMYYTCDEYLHPYKKFNSRGCYSMLCKAWCPACVWLCWHITVDMDFPPLSSFTPVSLEWRMVPRLAWIFCNLQVTVDSRNRSTLHKGGSVDTVSRTIAGTSPLKTRDSAIIRQDIGLYLKGSASTWWTMELDDVTMTSLCQSFLSACTHIHSRFQLVVPSQERLSA